MVSNLSGLSSKQHCMWYNPYSHGEMAERLNAAVSKTVCPATPGTGVQIPLSPPACFSVATSILPKECLGEAPRACHQKRRTLAQNRERSPQ